MLKFIVQGQAIASDFRDGAFMTGEAASSRDSYTFFVLERAVGGHRGIWIQNNHGHRFWHCAGFSRRLLQCVRAGYFASMQVSPFKQQSG